MPLPGTAAQVAELFDADVRDEVYGAEPSRIYDIANRDDESCVKELLAIAAGVSGPILELGCGTGRITVPLLEHGHEVVGLDLSAHALGVLAGRLDEPEHRQHANSVTLLEGDMTVFELGRRFELITMMGSAVWEIDRAQRCAAFARVRAHLAAGGCFLVQASLAQLDKLDGSTSEPSEEIHVFTLPDGDRTLLCTHFDYLDPASGVRAGTVLAHRMERGAIVKTTLFTEVLYLSTQALLEQDIEAAGLRVTARHTVNGDDPEDDPELLLEIALA